MFRISFVFRIRVFNPIFPCRCFLGLEILLVITPTPAFAYISPQETSEAAMLSVAGLTPATEGLPRACFFRGTSCLFARVGCLFMSTDACALHPHGIPSIIIYIRRPSASNCPCSGVSLFFAFDLPWVIGHWQLAPQKATHIFFSHTALRNCHRFRLSLGLCSRNTVNMLEFLNNLAVVDTMCGETVSSRRDPFDRAEASPAEVVFLSVGSVCVCMSQWCRPWRGSDCAVVGLRSVCRRGEGGGGGVAAAGCVWSA